MADCAFCGCHVSAGAKFCPACGSRLTQAEEREITALAEAWYAPEEEAGGWEEAPAPGLSLREIFSDLAGILSTLPTALWGVSLLWMLLTVLACTLGVLPFIWLPVVFALEIGACGIYMDALYGVRPRPAQLFRGFSKGGFLRYVCGMGWMSLWIFIWALIPIVGPVLALAKSYSYRFVPYIMLSDPEADAFQALERSKAMTRGLRLKMFLAELLLLGALLLAGLVLVLLSGLHIVGFVFALLLVVLAAAAVTVLPMVLGLLRAGFYAAAEKML